MTRVTHVQVLEDWGLQHPIEEMKARMLNENTTDGDPCVQDSTHPWWPRVLDSFIVPGEDKLVQIPPHTPGVACPTCGVMYLSRTSMLIHMSKAHQQDPFRPANQPIVFDKSRDAKDDYTYASIATRLCVTGQAYASTYLRSAALFYSTRLTASILLSEKIWMPQSRPHLHRRR